MLSGQGTAFLSGQKQKECHKQQIPATLQQKKQPTVEEQHTQWYTSKVSCPQLLDPVREGAQLFIHLKSD